MASTTIINHVHIFEESVIPLIKVNSVLPIPVKPEVLQRWMRRGINGAVLETAVVGKTRVTSKEAVQRFLNAINGKPEAEVRNTAPVMPRRSVESGRRKFNLPQSGRDGKSAEQ